MDEGSVTTDALQPQITPEPRPIPRLSPRNCVGCASIVSTVNHTLGQVRCIIINRQ